MTAGAATQMVKQRSTLEQRRDQNLRSIWAAIFWLFVSAVVGALVLVEVRGTMAASLIGGALGAVPGVWIGWYAGYGESALAKVLQVVALLTYPPSWADLLFWLDWI